MFYKQWNFLSNFYTKKNLKINNSRNLINITQKFYNLANFKFDDFFEQYKNYVKENLLDLFKETKYLYIFEFFISTLNNDKDIKKIKENNEFDLNIIAYYCLPKMVVNKKLLKNCDTDDFHKLNVFFKIGDIYEANFISWSYTKHLKTKHIYSEGYMVPVEYYDYIKHELNHYFYFSFYTKQKR